MGAGGDVSTRLDLLAEKVAFGVFKKNQLEATIIGEEVGVKSSGRKKSDMGYLVVDAIDGTTNANRGIPFYCCSIAYAEDFKLSSVTDAAVIDLFTGRLYSASKGKGAAVDYAGRRSRIRHAAQFGGIIGLNISSVDATVTTRLAPVIQKARHVRQFGSVALELCYVASGLLDAYIDLRGKVRPTDLAAGYLIAKEAGAMVLAGGGSELDSSLDIGERMSVIACTNRAYEEFGPDLFK